MTDQNNLKLGTRLLSAVCDTAVIVVRAPAQPATVCCGGTPMLRQGAQVDPALTLEADGEGTLIGKRYEDVSSGLELLCTKSGAGALSVNGKRLPLKEAKALPASD